MAKKKVKIEISAKNKKVLFIALAAILIVGIGIIVFLCINRNKPKNTYKNNENNNNSNNEIIPSEVKEVEIVDLESKSRPYAVMVNNISVARPYQSGLEDAYIIYEMIAEGGITRFLALFKDQNTERIGTIRSARHYYLDYVLENDAYFVHWGWSPQAQSDIKTLDIDNINGLTYGTKYFWKDTSLNVGTEHTAYSSVEKLNAAVKKLKYRTETNKDLLLNYSADEINLKDMENAQVANNVSIKYSSSTTSQYTYDEETGRYLRSVNGKAHTDYVTKEQYSFENIITYQIKNTTIGGDDKGRQELDNIGTGIGYYISNGYAVPIKWEKKNRSSQTKYYFENGEELIINDGNTFIQIQPKGQKLNIS